MGLNKFLNIKKEKTKKTCKGLFYRFYRNVYINERGNIENKQSLRLLKRKSCKGCDQCEWIKEYIHEDAMENGDYYFHEMVHGAMYELEIKMVPRHI